MMTLVAFAERAKGTYVKEQKYTSKKVYGIVNSLRKKSHHNSNNSPVLLSPKPEGMGGGIGGGD